MLSEEEIEKIGIKNIEISVPLNPEVLEKEYRNLYIRHKTLLGEKQKLIEKLDEDNKKAKEGFEATLSSYKYGIMDYTQEILEILKGEKE